MYPLPVILIGHDENVLPHVRRELRDQGVRLGTEFRDIDRALAGLRLAPDEMQLFIVHLEGPESLPKLRQLSGIFVGRPILALLGAPERDPAFLLNAMRAGAAQIAVLPLQAEDFRASLNCIALQFGRSATDTQLLAVSGVTGGCGTTTLAVNLAYEIAHRHGLHCLLLELSFRMGVLATYLNIEPRYTTLDLLRISDRLDVFAVQQALTRVADRLDVLAGPYRAIALPQTSAQDVARLIECAKQLAAVVVLDLPCSYDDLYFETLATANHVVLVGEQKVPSVRALKLVQETLQREAGQCKQHLVINRYDPKVSGFDADRLQRLLQVPRLHTIADDPEAVTAAVNNGRPLRLEAPQAGALADIDALADLLTERGDRPEPKKATPTVLGRLVHAFGLS
jgi:pilus assembly protein CpaE